MYLLRKDLNRLILWTRYSHMKSNRDKLKDLNLSPKSPSRDSTRGVREAEEQHLMSYDYILIRHITNMYY